MANPAPLGDLRSSAFLVLVWVKAQEFNRPPRPF
jgi:hypothetical protein